MGIRRWLGASAAGAMALGVVWTVGSGLPEASASTGPGKTLTIGVLTSETGAAAALYSSTEQGVEARLGLANADGGTNGYRIKYVMADDGTTPQTALTATEDLVEHDHVFAIVTDSPVLFAVASYTTKMGIPVLSQGQDGFEYTASAKNLFPALGSASATAVSNTFGTFWKKLGVTNMGFVGYGSSPTSSGQDHTAAMSAQAAGIKVGYTNTNLAFGSTDVGPIVLGLKNAGVNGVYLPIDSNSAFAIVTGLNQSGVKLNSALLASGYGGDLLADPTAVQSAQGNQFPSFLTPVEMKTPETKTFQAALAKYAGVDGEPTFAENMGWLVTDLFLYGLQKAGSRPTDESFITNLRKVTNYTAGDMLPAPVTFAKYGYEQAGTVSNCFYAVTLQGKSFVPIKSASPICGKLIHP